MRNLKKHGWLFIGFLLLGLSGFLCQSSEQMIAGFDRAIGPNAQCSWPSTQGSVTGSVLENHVHANGEDDWQFTVRFEYEIEGRRYSSRQDLRDFLVMPAPDVPKYAEVPYLFQACPDLPNVREAVALFRAAHDTSEFFPGRPVVVYYNPADKRDAVLAPGLIFGGPMSYGETIWIILVCVPAVAGIALPIIDHRSRQKRGTSGP